MLLTGVTSTAEARNLNGGAILREGKTYLGRDYKHTGLDCSMLTRRVYKQFGVLMPDNPTSQFHYGRRVRDPRRGDLVFFRENGRGNGITHVGIYAGKGDILHASSYFDEVVISKMRYLDGYAGARTF